MHLDDDSYRRLLDHRLTGWEATTLAAHLQGPCATCEAWLARAPADPLDGCVDEALLSLARRPAIPRADDLAFARIERELRRVPPRRRRWVPALTVAATLAAGLAVMLRPAAERPEAPAAPAWDGVKGAAPAVVPLRLRFAVLTPAIGGPPSLERGVAGQEVPASASLQFQVELGRAANVLVARAASGGVPEVLFVGRLEPGRHPLTVDGQPAAYPLAALSGRQRFLALASEAPLGPADAARALAAAAAAFPTQDHPITLDEVEIRVRP